MEIKIVGAFLIGVLLGTTGLWLGMEHPKVMTPAQVADNIEYITYYTSLPSIMRNPDLKMSELKTAYTAYSNMQSRILLEHYAWIVCYTNMTTKEFKRQQSLWMNDTKGIWK